MTPQQRKSLHAALDHAINVGALISVSVHTDNTEDEHRTLAALHPTFDFTPWKKVKDRDVHVRTAKAGKVTVDVFGARNFFRIPDRTQLPEFQR